MSEQRTLKYIPHVIAVCDNLNCAAYEWETRVNFAQAGNWEEAPGVFAIPILWHHCGTYMRVLRVVNDGQGPDDNRDLDL